MFTESDLKEQRAEKRTLEEFLISEDSRVIRDKFRDAVGKAMRNELKGGEISLNAELAFALQSHGISADPYKRERLFWQLVCYEARNGIFSEMYGGVSEDSWKNDIEATRKFVEREFNVSVPHLGRLLYGPDANLAVGIDEFKRQFGEFLGEKFGKDIDERREEIPHDHETMQALKGLVESADEAVKEVREEGHLEKPAWFVPEHGELKKGKVLVMLRQSSGGRSFEYNLEIHGEPYEQSPDDWWISARELPYGEINDYSLSRLGIEPGTDKRWDARGDHPVRWANTGSRGY